MTDQAIPPTAKTKERGGWWWKFPLGLIVFLLVALLVIIWQLSPIATAVANRQLPAQLRTDASVERIDVKFWDGYAAVQGLRIAQPAGFGEDSLVELDRLHVRLDLGSALSRDPLIVQEVDVDGLRARLVKKADVGLNLDQIGPPEEPAPEAGEAMPAEEAPPVAEPTKEPAPPLPGLRLDRLSVNDVSVTYLDESLESPDEPIALTVDDLNILLENLVAFDPALFEQPATLSVEAKIEQPEQPPALLDVQSRIGLIQLDVPEVNGQIVLTGILLETFGALVPAGVGTAIGGSGADITASLGLNAETVDLDGRVVTDQGNKYPIGVKGPLEKPSVEFGPLLLSVMGRLGGGLAKHAVAGAADGALDLARGTSEEAVELVQDAGAAAKGVAGGLFRSATSLMKGDIKDAGSAAKDATVGVATQAAGDVKGIASEVGATALDTGDSLTGGERSQDWIDAMSERHQEATEKARQALADMPWPPPVVEAPQDAKPDEQQGEKKSS